ncbi:MAG: hypothetical protein DI586_02600, partial [Micavibrio aeruginosavorus]
KKNTSLTSPLELVIHDRLSETRIHLRQRIFAQESQELMDKFDRGEALGQLFPDIGDTRDKASQLATVERSMAYYQYHGYGQNCTVHSASLDQALRAYQSRRISYGS